MRVLGKSGNRWHEGDDAVQRGAQCLRVPCRFYPFADGPSVGEPGQRWATDRESARSATDTIDGVTELWFDDVELIASRVPCPVVPR